MSVSGFVQVAKELMIEVRMASTNTVGHTAFEACRETVRPAGTSTKKRVPKKQDSSATLQSSVAGSLKGIL